MVMPRKPRPAPPAPPTPQELRVLQATLAFREALAAARARLEGG